MTDYPYDPDLPYVVPAPLTGTLIARFKYQEEAERYAKTLVTFGRVIDTTPKPRVPDDAKFITYLHRHGSRLYARRLDGGMWLDHDNDIAGADVESLPGVTPDTVFTVLDERKS